MFEQIHGKTLVMKTKTPILLKTLQKQNRTQTCICD